jgi:hypothetical protein
MAPCREYAGHPTKTKISIKNIFNSHINLHFLGGTVTGK